MKNTDTDQRGQGLPAEHGSAGSLLTDTRIDMAGVMRCCLATVAEEYEGKDGQPDQRVTVGMKSHCRHCKEPFTLVSASPYPKWTPDRYIPQNTQEVAGEALPPSFCSPSPNYPKSTE